MPLIDTKAIVEIEIDEDTYSLRKFLGFYEQAQMGQSAFTFRFPSDWDGQSTEKVEAVPNTAGRKLAKLRAYLVGWSHAEPLNDENIKRLPPNHANRLLDEIKALEEADVPFRGEPGAKGTD